MEKKSPLVSVIVPVYDTEKYLSDCIRSILSQTYKKIEVILVDDGSEDGSLKICEKFAKEDKRIKIIHVSHQGIVSTRKTGVKEAKGEYCIFVDSDDWIDSHLIEVTVSRIEDGTVDIVNYNLYSVDGSVMRSWKYTVMEGLYEKNALESIYEKLIFDFQQDSPGIIQSLCTKLVRKELLWKCLENVDDQITLGEDAAVTYHIMLEAEKVVVLYQPFYFYRMRPESMCHSPDFDIFNKLSLFCQYMQKVLNGYSSCYGLEVQLRAYLLNYITKGLKDVFSINLKERYRIPNALLSDIDSKIVLYGAGRVGKSYYIQLLETDDIDVVAWIDKRKTNQKIYGCRIEAPQILKTIKFDKIIIAIQDGKIAEEIIMELKEFVLEEQILWAMPVINWREREIEL